MIGDHADDLPLETWQKLAGYAAMPVFSTVNHSMAEITPRVDLSATAMRDLLRELRGDYGADSAFYRETVQRVRRGERFAIERLLAGEPLYAHGLNSMQAIDRAELRPDAGYFGGDFGIDNGVHRRLLDAKWNAIKARCPLTKDLPAAVARMAFDPSDDLDVRALFLTAPVWHSYLGASTKDGIKPDAVATIGQAARVLRDLALHDMDLAKRPTYRASSAVGPGKVGHARVSGGFKLGGKPSSYIETWAERQRNIARPGPSGLIAAWREEFARVVTRDGKRPPRSFCGSGAVPFATEAALREHAHHEPAMEDECWTDTLLRQMIDSAAQREGAGEYADLWTDASLTREMQSCETPTALRKPLLEFLGMMRIVRDKFPSIAQREAQAQELYDRFVRYHDVQVRPAHTAARAKPGPLSPARQRPVAHRVLMAITLTARNYAFDHEKWLDGAKLEARTRGLDEPTRKILRDVARKVYEATPLLDYWTERFEEEKARTGRTPHDIASIWRQGDPPGFSNAVSNLHKEAYARLNQHYDRRIKRGT